MLLVQSFAGEGNGLDIRLFDADAQFFIQLANQSGFRSFPRLNLASRELPEAGHRLAFRSLLHENSAILVNQGGGCDK